MSLYTHDNSTHDDPGAAGDIHRAADKLVGFVYKFTIGKFFELGTLPFSEGLQLIAEQGGHTVAHLIEGAALELTGSDKIDKEGKITPKPTKLRHRTDLTKRVPPPIGFGSTGVVPNPPSIVVPISSFTKTKRCPIGYSLKNGMCKLI